MATGGDNPLVSPTGEEDRNIESHYKYKGTDLRMPEEPLYAEVRSPYELGSYISSRTKDTTSEPEGVRPKEPVYPDDKPRDITPCQGTPPRIKDITPERVRSAHEEYEYSNVKPSDSISQYGGSCTSSRARSIASEKARAISREIQIAAKVAILERKYEMERRQAQIEKQAEREEYEARIRRRDLEAQKAQLDFQKEQLVMQTELEAAKAVSQVYRGSCSDNESDTSRSSKSIAQAIIRRATEIKQQGTAKELLQEPPADEEYQPRQVTKKVEPAQPAVHVSDLNVKQGPVDTNPVYRNSEFHERNQSEPADVSGPALQKPKLEPPQPVTQQQQQQQHDLTKLTQLLIKQQVRASLPQQRIMVFDGDPLKYTTFIKAFEFGVEERTEEARERLTYLCQYTSGEAKTLVNSCLHYENPEEGYLKAKEMLQKRFGHGHKIAQSALKKAKEWADVKDEGKSLNEFSLFLTECLNMMGTVKSLNELDHTNTIQILVGKLPWRLKNMWRTRVFEIEEKQRSVVFRDLVEFVDRQAQIQSNPAFGNIRGDDKYKKKNQDVKPARRTALSTGVTLRCMYCGEGKKHATIECRKLQKLTPKQKSTFCFEKKLCFGCLEAGHTKSSCEKKEVCKKCSKTHPTVLHDADRTSRPKPQNMPANQQNQTQEAKKQQETSSKKAQEPSNNVNCGLTGTGSENTKSFNSSIVPVVIRSRESGCSVRTYAYVDSGSNAVFCTQKLKRQLCVKGRKTTVQIQTITGERESTTYLLKNLEITDLNGEHMIPIKEAFTQESIPVSSNDILTDRDVEAWPYLESVHLPELDDNHVGILIGNNIPKAMEPWEIINSQDDGPYAVKTLLGWTVHGVKRNSQSQSVSVNRIVAKETIEEQLIQMYNMDFSEILSDDRRAKSKEDHEFLKIAANSIQLTDGHYELALPFRHEDMKLPNNRQLAQQRAENLRRRFIKDPTFHREYTSTMEKVLKAGHAEKVPDSETEGESGRVWYIPHHGVYHPQKGKLRVVYDCASTYKGTSLNQELLQGPDLTSSLVGVLLRFRQEPIAMISDIESMFYQVHVREKDRDVMRFLWWPDGDLESGLVDYRMKVHVFGATSSPACANYALHQTAKDNKDSYDEEIVSTLKNNFYVDDLLKSKSTEEKAASLAHHLMDICGKGGFRLTKWVSNSKPVMESIPSNERSDDTRSLDLDESLPSQRALGMLWLIESDKFGYKLDIKDKPITRRGMLSVICSLYDPLGFVSPAILPAKQMLQELCKRKVGWDDEIPEEIRNKWIKWLSSLPELENFQVPRCWKPAKFEDPSSVQVHHFCDASDSGYGVASYLRFTNHDGEVACNLMMSKARVAPIKQISIPRMELTAATVAVKLDTMLKRELEITVDQTVFWSDSQTVLKYIGNNQARYPVFVANRVGVIRDGTDPTQWRYVPSELNTADHASRGLTVKQLLSKHEWLQGPNFLYSSLDDWPSAETTQEDSKLTTTVIVNALKQTPASDDKITVNSLMDYYSEWTNLKRAVAWWLRLKKILLQRARGADNQQVDRPRCLTAADLEEAEVAVLKFVQQQEYPREIAALQASASHVKTSVQKATDKQNHLGHDNKKNQIPNNSNILNLDPELNGQGLLVVGGRLRNAKIPSEAKHQVILPPHHHISTLLITHTHKKLNHQGRNHTIADLRRRYWIVKIGVRVKGLLKKCVTCKKIQAKVSHQKMADLPASRVEVDDPPFTRTGVDYFGPFEIKVGRSIKKRYGVIFTCFTSRAVHLEVAETLDTASCINAIRRFISRRGQVKELYSDNGTNFVGACKELKKSMEEWKTEEIEAFAANKGIHWKFNPPGASHFGGLWERQIRSIRKILQSILTEQHLKTCQSEEHLHTLMCEVEATLNSRPLIQVSDDPNDYNAISPNDLLLVKPAQAIPPGVFDQKDLYAKRRWRQVQYLADLFWKRWLTEYLPTLQKRQKWLKPERNVQVGDIVLIVDNSTPRNLWPLGRVEEVHIGNQGLVRSAKIRTKTSLLTRPVTKLCLLLEQEN